MQSILDPINLSSHYVGRNCTGRDAIFPGDRSSQSAVADVGMSESLSRAPQVIPAIDPNPRKLQINTNLLNENGQVTMKSMDRNKNKVSLNEMEKDDLTRNECEKDEYLISPPLPSVGASFVGQDEGGLEAAAPNSSDADDHALHSGPLLKVDANKNIGNGDSQPGPSPEYRRADDQLTDDSSSRRDWPGPARQDVIASDSSRRSPERQEEDEQSTTSRQAATAAVLGRHHRSLSEGHNHREKRDLETQGVDARWPTNVPGRKRRKMSFVDGLYRGGQVNSEDDCQNNKITRPWQLGIEGATATVSPSLLTIPLPMALPLDKKDNAAFRDSASSSDDENTAPKNLTDVLRSGKPLQRINSEKIGRLPRPSFGNVSAWQKPYKSELDCSQCEDNYEMGRSFPLSPQMRRASESYGRNERGEHGFNDSNVAVSLRAEYPYTKKKWYVDIRIYVLCLCLLYLLRGVQSAYMVAVLTTIEKRFGFSSAEAGLLTSADTAGYLISIIFISYYGSDSHKPRILSFAAILIAAAGVICSTPHFIFGGDPSAGVHPVKPHNLKNTSDTDLLCLPSEKNLPIKSNLQTPPSCAASDSVGSVSNSFAYFVLALGQTVLGIGASPLNSLGVTYVYENCAASQSSFYIGKYQLHFSLPAA